MFDAVDKFLVPSLLNDTQPAIAAGDFKPARCECPAEDDVFRVLADVNEASDADDPVGEAADIDAAGGIDFNE